jgi:hydrogenase large subunit
MEVGPLARVLMLYAKGHQQTKDLVGMTLSKLDVPVQALFSTLGRTAARGLEASYSAQLMKHFQDKLVQNIKNGDSTTANVEKWDPSTWPSEAKGVGFAEAPRGALGHWIRIKDGRIENYQCVVPTTWNGSPRDPAGNIGAFEAALLGTPLAKADEPLEILRTLHSFDPCLACAAHVMGPDGAEMSKVQVR